MTCRRFAKCRLKRTKLENLWGKSKRQVALPSVTRECTMYFCINCKTETRHQDPIPEKGAATCQICGTENKIPWLPLFVITGGGGCGKTMVGCGLQRKQNPFFVLEADHVYCARKAFDSGDGYWNYMTHLCRNLTINQIPVVLCGWVSPSQIEESPHADWFSAIHYLVISCDATTQEARLKDRHHKNRLSSPTRDKIDMCVRATRIISEEALSINNGTVLDTTHLTQEQAISTAERWILARLDVGVRI